MKNQPLINIVLVIAVFGLMVSGVCSASDDMGKIPITTSSDDAMANFLKGRDLFEKLRAQDSRQYFEKAVAADSNFAMGYMYLALAQPSAKGFFKQFNRAMALKDKVSEGERIWLMGFQAGVNGMPMKQREMYQKLVAAFPKDERAHNLLGTNYFAQQEWAKAIDEYSLATRINPDFSQPYNQLGYAHRFSEDYAQAEEAFETYISLIPDDPNPYDSYAELMMKMGKYDESIETYRKALKVDPNFVASHIGIATNLNYLGKHQEARIQLQELLKIARNDGERRQAYFAMAVSLADEGKLDDALAKIKMQFDLADKINDAAAMAGDFVTMGNILLEANNPDEAMKMFETAVKRIQESDLTQEIKANAERGFLFNAGRVALKKNDIESARARCMAYSEQTTTINNPFQIRLSHQLKGMIALQTQKHEKAIEEFEQANLQNPYNLYRLGLAYEGTGNTAKAMELFEKTTNFNALNNMNQAFIRSKAKRAMATK